MPTALRGLVTGVPDRIRWAVEALDVQPEDDLLELGCGAGVAGALVCDRLAGGTITAIDRSPLQIERAARRNANHVAAGKARYLVADLESAGFPNGSFDTIFAINVNHFWTPPGSPALDSLAGLLTSAGRLALFYDTPSPDRTASIERILRETLVRPAFVDVTSTSTPFLGVVARRA